MSNKTVFLIILSMIFVATLGVGMTLLLQEKTSAGLDVLAGGAFLSIFVIIVGGATMVDD